MDAKILIQIMRENLKGVRKQNIKQFPLQNVENWVDILSKFVEASPDKEPTQEQKELQQRQWEGQMAHYDAQVQSHLEGFRSTMQLGQAALKSSVLINGAAAIAMLAFIGHIWNSGQFSSIQSQISGSLIWFLFGVFVSAVATGTGYVTQVFYFEFQDHKIALRWRIISVVLIVFSYIFFLLGGYNAQKAFNTTLPEGVKTEINQSKSAVQEKNLSPPQPATPFQR